MVGRCCIHSPGGLTSALAGRDNSVKPGPPSIRKQKTEEGSLKSQHLLSSLNTQTLTVLHSLLEGAVNCDVERK